MKKDSGNKMTILGMTDKCVKFLYKFITPANLLFFFIILYVASLIPLFWIGCYNYPVADDYTFGAACRNVWMESHSVIAVIMRAVTRAWEYYLNWAGCMSSSFFMALQPGVFGEGLYKITPFLMIGITSISVLYFMRAVFIKFLKGNPHLVYSITVFMLFVMIQCMPEPAEGLFWYNGSLHYTFMNGISLFLYGTLISALLEKNVRSKRRGFIISAILGFIAGMGNFMTALNVGIVFALLILTLIIGKKFKEQRFITVPAIVTYLAFIINVAAPGNAVRAATSDGMNPIKAIFASFYYVLDYCLGDWSSWVVLIFTIVTATLFWNVSKGVEFNFPYPLFAVVLNYCILAAMITPPLYGSGNIEAGRIKSLIYIMYILLLTLTVCYVTGWAQKRLEGAGIAEAKAKVSKEAALFPNSKASKEDAISPNSKAAVAACIAFLFVGSVLCVIPNPEYYTFSMAAVDIINGNAKTYAQAMTERIEIYNNSTGMDVEVPPLPVKPKLLCTSDISEDSEDWINLGVCRFYGLNSVRVSNSDD